MSKANKDRMNAVIAAREDGKLTIDELANQIDNQWGAMHEQWGVANQAMDAARLAGFRVGQYLLEARTHFKGDREFGKWRTENTPVGRSWATRLIQIAKQYESVEDLPIGINLSALAILSQDNVPDDLRKEIERAAEEGAAPSVRQIQEQVKEANDPPRATSDEQPQEGEIITKDEELPMPKAMQERLKREQEELEPVGADKMIAHTQKLVDAPRDERVKRWLSLNVSDQNATEAFVLLGMTPFFDGRPNLGMLIDLVAYCRESYGGTHWDHAYTAIKKEIY